MSDIFISYARSTEGQAKQIAETLRGLGYEVWRDDEIPANRAYADVIAERLAAAKAVLVIWSEEAARSQWVFSEANRAREDGKLVQLTVDGFRLPMPFDSIQCADFLGRSAGDDSPGWRQVIGAIAGLVSPDGSRPIAVPRPAAVRKLSICVLPFANLSGDPEQEYFSDGISEDIITDLCKVSALNVASRNSAFAYKGKTVEMAEIARKLGVSHVLEGSVRRAGSRVRITAQLIETATDSHSWAERWDRDLNDIFALQDEISQAVVAALKIKLLPAEKKAIQHRGTDNVEAYNLYLMARRHLLSESARRRDLVIRLCQGAVDLDPAYARAWALMARCKAARVMNYAAGKSGDDGWEEAERAVSLDPNLAEAHATKARILRDRGQFAKAQAEIDVALALDPLANDANSTAGLLALVDRRFAEAIRRFETAAEADEQDGGSPFMAMQCYESLGDAEGARASAQRAVDRLEKASVREPENGSILAFGVCALSVLGEAERARDWARQAVQIDPDDGLLRYNLACAMTRLGDFDSALEYVEAAWNLGGATLVHWGLKDSDLDPLREDPRFKALIEKAEAGLAGAE